MGLLPPFSGEYNNHNKNSNGCFIRSEIWACLMPGHPELAVNCGEDADCTAATLGSVLGIIMGADKIPQKWIEPIGDEIKTISLDLTDGDLKIPATVSELTRRVCALMPVFMKENYDILNEEGIILKLSESEKLYCNNKKVSRLGKTLVGDKFDKEPHGIRRSNTILEAVLGDDDGINIAEVEEKTFTLTLKNLIRKRSG